MKKILILPIVILFATISFAQKDVTKFLGIPVDETKSEMIRKLKAKGFTSSSYANDILVGEFNGVDVNISIQTNNNKVWRIIVADVDTRDEGQIKIRFNDLCQQFQNNKNYVAITDYTLSDNEKISYKMKIDKKYYQAVYNQAGETVDATANKIVWFTILELEYSYGEYYIVMYYENNYNKANGDDL